MLAFFLGLLKFIGITLLVLIILVLLILSIVLFVPIRYNGSGIIDKTRKEAEVKVTWLLHAISAKVNYKHPDKPSVIIKVLGINIEKFQKKSPPKRPVNKNQISEISFEKVENAEDSVNNDSIVNLNISSVSLNDTLNKEHQQSVNEYITKKEKKKETLQDKINKIVNKLTSVYNKIIDVLANIRYYIDLLEEEGTKNLLNTLFDALLKILKKIRPRKLIMNAEIGFDTPDLTGKVYGLFWVIKPILGENVDITPNFEKKILEGDIYFKGKIRIITLLINGLRIIFNKNFKPFLKKFKNGGLNNGR